MAQEQLQLIITADNKDALKAIEDLAKSTEGLKYKFQQSKGATDQATQALVNLSRVAQDAPYGFIGIANNLNPLLESFQRLNTSAKDTGTSLGKELKNALIGPAGIGLALGVVSSLFIKFGDDIQNFINNKISGLGEAFNKETDLFKKSGDAYVKASTDINKLRDSFDEYQNGLITKEKFLKEFNSTLGDTIGKTTDLATAEKFLTDYADIYVQMTLKKSVANLAAAEAAKKLFEIEQTKAKPQQAFKEAFDFTTIFFGGTIDQIKDISKARQNTIIKNAEEDINIFQQIEKRYDKQAAELKKKLTDIFGPATTGNAKATFESDVQEYRKILDREFDKIKKTLGTRKPEDVIKQPELKAEAPKFFKGSFAVANIFEQNATQFDKAAADAEKFNERYTAILEDIRKNVAGSLGESIGEILAGNDIKSAMQSFLTVLADGLISVGKLAIATGLAIEGIKDALKTLNPVVAVTAGIALIALGTLVKSQLRRQGEGLGSTPKMAEGGIVTKPTLALVGEGNESEAVMPLSKLKGFLNTSFNAGAMSGTGAGNGQFVLKGNDLVLALQRSNYNLNLRRGI